MQRLPRPLYIVAFLFSLTIGLYGNSLINVGLEPSVAGLDDGGLMKSFINHRLTVDEVLAIGGSDRYYRPLVTLSFLFDQRLSGDVPYGYRLTNVCIHIFNVILLYMVARLSLKKLEGRDISSFFAAILFAVHPIAVESVCWISGRTDPMATFWSLLAILFYLLSKDGKRWYLIPFSLLFIGASVLSKEVGIAAIIVIGAWELFYCRSFGYERGKYSLPVFLLSILIVPLYLKLRSSGLEAGDVGLGLVKSSLLEENLFSNMKVFLASFGFYLKKFIYPFPLNFAIAEIDTTIYAFVGLAAALSLGFFAFSKRGRIYHFFYLWALLGIGPAALVSFTKMAWTPWAERYLYFSMAPLSLMAGMMVFKLHSRLWGRKSRSATILLVSLILILFMSSYQRSMLWNDNLRLWGDTYKKSPPFKKIAVYYAGALADKGELDEAERVLIDARELPGANHMLFYYLGLVSRDKGNYAEAKGYLLNALKEVDGKQLGVKRPGLRRDILSAIADIELEEARLAE